MPRNHASIAWNFMKFFNPRRLPQWSKIDQGELTKRGQIGLVRVRKSHMLASGRLENVMRAALLALLAVGTVSVINTAPAKAWGWGFGPSPTYPVCMHTLYDGEECNYTSYQQCMWSASGLGETCFDNPALAYGLPDGPAYGDRPARRRHHSRHARND
jgi:hypothetical protein